jgi:hypothetical protein
MNREQIIEVLDLEALTTKLDDEFGPTDISNLSEDEAQAIYRLAERTAQVLQMVIDARFPTRNGESYTWPLELAIWEHPIAECYMVCPYLDKEFGSWRNYGTRLAQAYLLKAWYDFHDLELGLSL